MRRAFKLLPFVLVLAACSSSSSTPTPPPASNATVADFDLDADPTDPGSFYASPWPSDLRVDASGHPIANIPDPLHKTLLEGLLAIDGQRVGWPVIPVAYFHFDAALAPSDESTVIAADKASPILLVDLADQSLTPTVAITLTTDEYVPDFTLAVAPRPGFVLHPKHTYAIVVKTSLADANGKPLGTPAALATLLAGGTPSGKLGTAAAKVYAPLLPALGALGVDPKEVADATVFTTGDVVADLAALSDAMVAKYSVTIDGLKVDPDDGATHDRFCELVGTVTYPQFQSGKPPYDTDGLFVDGADGLPLKQRDEVAPIVISFPKTAMPTKGYPLTIYFHGSGGYSNSVVDRGTWVPMTDTSQCAIGAVDTWNGVTGCNTKGQGPAYVLAPFGIATAGSALPLNPERSPGASDTAYLNLGNLAAFRDTFRQGVIEQRIFLAALRSLQVAPETVTACTGLSLPPGTTAYHFADDPVIAQGQSMGGMYTNLISAVEPRIKAAVPTGAGGFWSYFIATSHVEGFDLDGLVSSFLSTADPLSYAHPTLAALELGWEISDPVVFMPRLAKRPLPGHPVRSIYEPVGKDDSYFPTTLYDAIALSYEHVEAGDKIWPTMQDALSLEGLGGLAAYPLAANLSSESGTKYTAAVIQYAGDGVYDPHAIYSQLDTVKYQYGCFQSSFLAGKPTIATPAPLGTPCP